jgi:hypothetical protein
LNASGTRLDGGQAGFFVDPVRGVAAATPVLTYDTTTKEIRYNSSTRAIKKNIIDLTANTETLFNLREVEFDGIADDKHYYGLIAEEAHDANPYFAWTEGGAPKGIDWSVITLFELTELRKLKSEVAELRKLKSDAEDLEKLKLEVAELREMLSK